MVAHSLLTGIEEVRRNWGWFLALGIALIVLGGIALAALGMTTLASVLYFGMMVLLAGVCEAAAAFWARQWSGFFLHLLVGVLYVVVGVLMIGHPAAAAAGLTLILAVLFLTGGLFRIIAAIMMRYPNWGWSVFDGAVSLIMGVLILAEWPSTALWVIGMFVGITLLLRGFSWVMFALAIRRLPRAGEADRHPATGARVPSPV